MSANGTMTAPTVATTNTTPTSNNHHQQTKLIDNIEDRLHRYRAKRLRFLINGDKYFAGINYALNTEKIRSFDALLNDLTRSLSMDHLKLCKGVRYIFSIDGTLVQALTDFLDGQTYICSSTDTYMITEYRISNGMLNWLVRNSACISSTTDKVRNKRNALQSPLPSARLQPATNRSHQRQSSPLPRQSNRLNPSQNTHNNQNASGTGSSGLNGNHHQDNHPHLSNRVSNQNHQSKTQATLTNTTTTINTPTQTRRHNRYETSHSSNTTNNNSSNNICKSPNLSSNCSSNNKTTTPRTTTTNTNHKATNSSTILQLKQAPKKIEPQSQQAQPQPQPQQQQQQQQQLPPAPVGLFGQEVITKYDIGRPIGDGHFSVVYCCMNKITQEFCALKLIDKLKCRGRDDMIYNEVKILKQLNHPNIVKLIEEFDYSKQLYLILELVQDGDLFDAISNVTKFGEVDVSTMIHNLSSALTYLHKQGIVHRDIKPENLLILVQEDGSQSVKLADFGLAVEVSDTPLYSVCGTAFYVSPEMLNETGYSYKVDVWSTGVICFILLCGYPPFTSENENNQDELFDAILAGDFQFAPPYWSKISQEAKNLIRCMLTVDPEKRYTAEQVFTHSWTMGTSRNFDGINPMNMSRKIALQSH